ncbi:ROK family protein [Microbacterium sp. 2FI]|uniref:ROK family protein n=1 Tax=Microbacterium sp. 2FI TaxID=2502193 RepID=UPI0010F837AF|nr:ROK family protein [Microbacterium sp. 2FI]
MEQLLALAVDLGGTKVESALVDADGRIVAGSRFRLATGPGITPDLLRDAIDGVVGETLVGLGAGSALIGAGVASAGPVDFRTGEISPVNMRQLGAGFPLVRAVADALGPISVAVSLGHDGGCIAIAESWLGATRDARTSLSFVVSTGIGGGIVHEGALMRGATGNAGHLGQMRVGPTQWMLEELASGPASVRWAAANGWLGRTGEDLSRDAAAGDAVARQAIERSARTIGQALADIAALIDLDAIAVGGGFAKSAPDYIDLVDDAFRSAVVFPHLRGIAISPSALGDDGPLIGAAALVWRAPSARPPR